MNWYAWCKRHDNRFLGFAISNKAREQLDIHHITSYCDAYRLKCLELNSHEREKLSDSPDAITDIYIARPRPITGGMTSAHKHGDNVTLSTV